MWLLKIAAITTLVLLGYSARAQDGPSALAATVAPPSDAQPLDELKAMLARVRQRLGSPRADISGSAPPAGGGDVEPSASRAAIGVASPSTEAVQLQRDLQAVRSLQAVLIRKLAETRDSLAAADRRSIALNREVADLRAQVVSASDEIRALRDRVQPAPPPDPPSPAVAATVALASVPLTTKVSDTAAPPQVLARLDGSVFRTGSAELQPEAAARLAAAGRFIAAHPAVQVRIVGHTDASGDDQRNLELSGRRAEAVRDYLADRFELPESRLLAEGKGELEPIATNDTAAGRQANRRVEVYVQP